MPPGYRFKSKIGLIAALCAVALTLIACASGSQEKMSPIKVEIVTTDSGFQLQRGGKPYAINGAGMGLEDIENFVAHGGNSIRNWSTRNESYDTRDLLDAAYANGVTVALCLTMQSERWGFDYDDDDAVSEQLELFREEVLLYRDHPALLVWIIGLW